MVPLIRRNASPTQNHARISRCTRLPMGSLGSSAFLDGVLTVSSPASLPLGFCFASAFTFHRHWLFDRCVVRSVAVALADFAGARFADHAHDFAAGRASNDGIVDENDALAFNESSNGIEF